jgi:glycosyltransferase involved in cell wall biosynthesis
MEIYVYGNKCLRLVTKNNFPMNVIARPQLNCGRSNLRHTREIASLRSQLHRVCNFSSLTNPLVPKGEVDLPKMRIGIDALFENVKTGSGGLTYLRQMIMHLGQLAEARNTAKCYVFVSPSARKVFGYQGVELVTCGSASEHTLGRIAAQQFTMSWHAARLGLSCLFCPGNVTPILAPVPAVLVIQNRLQFDLPRTYGRGRRLYRQIFSYLSIKRAAHVIAVSHDLAKYLVESVGVPANKISVVYEGVDWTVPLLHWKLPSPVKYPYVLNVSTLLEHKNHETLIRAFAILLRNPTFANYRLVMIGADPTARKSKLRRWSEELCVASSIVFVDHIDRDQLKCYYQNASVFVYPSLTESFGLPILEAMSQGTPVVASDRTAIPEVAGDAALVVNATDPEAMASAIATFLNDDALRGEFVARGYKRITCFDWAESAKQIYQILAQVSASKMEK